MSSLDGTTTDTFTSAVTALTGGPEDVVRHPGMTIAEKREVLARWASDAHAVDNAPALRQLDDGSVVNVEEILGALRSLDGDGIAIDARHPAWIRAARNRGPLSRFRVIRRPRGDEDDDPPPPPAAAAFPVRIRVADALAA